MKFHLDYVPERPAFTIGHHDKIVMIGSCFATNIGGFLADHHFDVYLNPDGILFNPQSISHCIESALGNRKFDERYLIERDGRHYSLFHHSSVCDLNRNALLKRIGNTSLGTGKKLLEANILIITFGTAFVYFHKQLSTVVSNCHKLPGSTFGKKLLEVNDIFLKYAELIHTLKKSNPSLKIIFTVSPVKYLKDGVETNNLSKAILLLAVHQLVSSHENCFYFPAYELITDDLRDYRFYKEDLAHPNEQAIEYVWDKFSNCYFQETTRKINFEIAKLNAALGHRKFNPDAPGDSKLEQFIENQKAVVMALLPAIKF